LRGPRVGGTMGVMSGHATIDLVPYTCFACRRTFKRPFERGVVYRKCPHCGGQALQMDIRFRPPRKNDDRQWAKVRFLVEHGFVFQKVFRHAGGDPERYPENMDQAREFVVEFSDQALHFPKPSEIGVA
jgi:hypothetical protein